MGLSVLDPNGTGNIPVRLALDVGPGEIFVSVALIYVLALLYLLDPVELEAAQKRQFRTMLVAVTIPLLMAFIGVILFRSFEVI